MNLGLAEHVALIAGSSRGIGKAIAREFLAEGARVVVTGRTPDALATTTRELEGEFGAERVLSFCGDLADARAISDVLARVESRWARLDVLVANIGSGRGQTGCAPPESEWRALFDVNLWPTVRLVTEALPRMVERKRGHVVLLSSIAGLEALPAPIPYSAAKAALVSYAKNLASVVGAHGVRVNAVAPGNVLFEGGSWERHLRERREEVESFVKREVPLRRFGTPEEIAGLVAFLSSERAAFITGACVVADGGQTRSF